ncbi:MAG: ATP-binding protein, partial [Bacteroidetes bacterium]|nr:ATP-binding protein [Bacteroidota bacterium]
MATDRICPYPGLRPFTVEESIFFKGRDEHIDQIIKLLEEKKFLMLTGDSGDGKSSIVYAGLIPNAKAGFFKAKFNNWVIADLTPSRTPKKNLGDAISKQLELDPEMVSKELNYGFSALIDLYKQSKFWVDTEGEEWKNADDAKKKELKKNSSNLMILVDQFEEFFTNPENYANGRPSMASVTVVNLLLETAKMAYEKDLPVYVICTMRSDYIGHCAAFRGLPEYIGFSQFFVPRLKRKETYQVIGEPAVLSGNPISQRLVETLINELNEGFDQLPLLQHTLNQIWNIIDEPGEEMDVYQLAKLSGIQTKYLSEQDQGNFDLWFEDIPEFKKKFFENPSLENVLNTHANELFETAHERSNGVEGEALTKEESQHILKKVFQCLTKVDDGKAVRSRMTVQEITEVINDPDIDISKVTQAIAVFRMQGNTLLKPFITDDPSTEKMDPDTVLDITHEALIRNWDLLKEWADEEYDHYLNYLDFDKQLARWIANDRSKEYVLAVGPLRYFETWHEETKPNPYWLVKYDESTIAREDKIKKAEAKIEDIIAFLKLSNKVISDAEAAKRRRRNFVLAAALIIIVALSGLSVWAISQRTEAIAQKKVADEKTIEALASKEKA